MHIVQIAGQSQEKSKNQLGESDEDFFKHLTLLVFC